MSGRLGKAALAAAANTDLYTVPAGKVTTASVNFFNTTGAEIVVTLSIRAGAAGAAPAAGETFDRVTVAAYSAAGWNRIPLSAGETITANAAAVGINAQVRGFEEVA